MTAMIVDAVHAYKGKRAESERARDGAGEREFQNISAMSIQTIGINGRTMVDS